jgi:hypothetical protein
MRGHHARDLVNESARRLAGEIDRAAVITVDKRNALQGDDAGGPPWRRRRSGSKRPSVLVVAL